MSRHKTTCLIKIKPPKRFTRTESRITDTDDSDVTLQTTSSIAERATEAVMPEAKQDDENDPDDVGEEDSQIINNIDDLHSHITHEDCLDVVS